MLSEQAHDVNVTDAPVKEKTRIAIQSKRYRWVPRQAANIESRTTLADHSSFEPFRNESPKLADLKGPCELATVDHPSAFPADIALKSEGGHVTAISAIAHEVRNAPPARWTWLPFIGDLFRNRDTSREIVKEIQPDDVLFIETQVPYWPAKETGTTVAQKKSNTSPKPGN